MTVKNNNDILSDCLQILGELIRGRLQAYFEDQTYDKNAFEATLLKSLDGQHPLGDFIKEEKLSFEEILVLILALAPHADPAFWDKTIQDNMPKAGDFPAIGGVRGKQFRGFLPTGETALFFLGAENLSQRITYQSFFDADHVFSKKRILWLEDVPEGEPRMSGKIVVGADFIDLLITGRHIRPRFSMSFPAQLLETKMEWEDLVLNNRTMQQIRELESWVKHGDTLLYDWKMDKRIKPGYRVLFHGPPGTGKTLTASLLGKYTNKEIYRIDLSMVVSKYIGETEKNLSNLFAKAENKDWILFFDEADALFGKRTNVRDAHDKYANQEVAFLLQRVEGYNGLVILASNFKSNIDEAFIRRFNAIIEFPIPKSSERLQIWERSFPEKVNLGEKVDLQQIARNNELSGAGILNVVQHACLLALEKGTTTITLDMIQDGIKKEYVKEGKLV